LKCLKTESVHELAEADQLARLGHSCNLLKILCLEVSHCKDIAVYTGLVMFDIENSCKHTTV